MPYNPATLNNLRKGGGFTEEQRQKSIATRKARSMEKWEKFFKLIEKGARPSEACKQAGVTMNGYYTKMREDPEFKERMVQAEAIASEPIEEAVKEAAIGGNVQAQKLWLEKRSPDRWPSDKRLTVENKQTLELEAGPRLARILALQDRLANRLELADPNIIDVEVEDGD